MLRVELDQVKHALNVALQDHQGEMRALIEQAIQDELKPEKVLELLRKEVREHLQNLVRDTLNRVVGNDLAWVLKEHLGKVLIEVAAKEFAQLLKAARTTRYGR